MNSCDDSGPVGTKLNAILNVTTSNAQCIKNTIIKRNFVIFNVFAVLFCTVEGWRQMTIILTDIVYQLITQFYVWLKSRDSRTPRIVLLTHAQTNVLSVLSQSLSFLDKRIAGSGNEIGENRDRRHE